MDVPHQVLKTESEMLPVAQQKLFSLLCNCSKALWSMSKSDKNKDVMRRSGIIPVMAKLLTSVHEDVVSSIMGIIVNCATQVDRNFTTYNQTVRNIELIFIKLQMKLLICAASVSYGDQRARHVGRYIKTVEESGHRNDEQRCHYNVQCECLLLF